MFTGSVLMRASRLVKTGAGALEHQSHRYITSPESLEFTSIQGSRVAVRVEFCFAENQFAHRPQIVDGALVTAILEPSPSLRIALLGSLTQHEEGFPTARFLSSTSYRQHFLRAQIEAFSLSGILPKNTVVAEISAESGQRDEDLGREGDGAALSLISYRAGLGTQILKTVPVGRVKW
jgi:hypothetical protein